MSLGTTRVLRDRKPSRPLPEEYQGSPPQVSHNLPQAYGTEFYHGYTPSEQSTGYNSPASSNWLPDDSSIAYDGDYGHSLSQYVADLPMKANYRHTPPTPARSDISIADPRYSGMTTWTRTANAPRSKPKKAKKVKDEAAKSIMPGDAPVPILSEDGEGPIEVINCFVHRSMTQRHKEVEGKNGYTPRPMNNFMLYRKAYQDKAKKVSSQTNHQVVSVVVAASWKNESKEIKERFARFAQIEKDHHIQAFPTYQFRPNKSAKAKKRKAVDFEDLSDLEDPGWRQNMTPKKTRQEIYPVVGTYTLDQQQQHHHQYMPQHPYPPGTYQVECPAQQLYYDQHQQWYQPHIEHGDMAWHEAQVYQDQLQPTFNAAGLSGLPGGGDVLLEQDFSNAVFGEPVVPSQDQQSVPSNDPGPGPFTQSEFESLDHIAATEWQDSRTSIDAKTLASAFQHHTEEFNNDFFDAAA